MLQLRINSDLLRMLGNGSQAASSPLIAKPVTGILSSKSLETFQTRPVGQPRLRPRRHRMIFDPILFRFEPAKRANAWQTSVADFKNPRRSVHQPFSPFHLPPLENGLEKRHYNNVWISLGS
jgi:hypothetical protein